MYKGIKSKVVANGTYSEWFECTVGVRQGVNLSPFLFLLYLNDLEEFLLSNNVYPISQKKLRGSQLDIVNNSKYLGVTFSKMNSFNLNIKELYEKATKATCW